MIHEESLDTVFRRHADMAALVHRSIDALGLKHQCPSLTRRATTVTAIELPPEHPPAQVRDALKRRGLLVAGALEHFQPTGVRIGHMGDIRIPDVEQTLAALRDVLTGR
jgi:aspartate aminotransferase-like enzyme